MILKHFKIFLNQLIKPLQLEPRQLSLENILQKTAYLFLFNSLLLLIYRFLNLYSLQLLLDKLFHT